MWPVRRGPHQLWPGAVSLTPQNPGFRGLSYSKSRWRQGLKPQLTSLSVILVEATIKKLTACPLRSDQFQFMTPTERGGPRRAHIAPPEPDGTISRARCSCAAERDSVSVITRENISLFPSIRAMADQVGACAVALRSLHDLIAAHVLAAERLHGDDTPVPVLARDKTDR